jgi:two-component system, NtrC family, nitrogen regulation sensor histidine kinase NtrY
MNSASERPTLAWLAAAAGAILLGAVWLRGWGVPYLVGTLAAMALALVLALRWVRRPMAWAALVALAWFAADAVLSARTFARLQRDASDFEADRAARAGAVLAATLRADVAALRNAAERALDLPADPADRFGALEDALPSAAAGELSAIVFDGERATTWMGPVRVAADSLVAPGGVVWTDFYAVVYASATRGSRRAVMMRVLAAVPPADRLASSLAARVAAREGVRPFDLSPTPLEGFAPLAADVMPGLWVRSVPLGAGPARLRVEEHARLRGGLALAAALLAVLAVAWRRPAPPWRRFALLGVGLGVVWFLPLSALSNRAAVFDPSFYYTPLGGPFSASVGALALTGAVAVLALFALRRVRGGRAMRLAAPLVVLLVAVLGPFLLRDLARGITPPSRGVPALLWMAWEVALFLAATAVLLTAARAGQVTLRGRRGLPPMLAPMLAAAAALIAPVLWDAPGRWPGWYPLPWIAAMIALAFARRARGLVLRTSFVAACGAATLVWGAVARQRVALAERDVRGLATAEPETRRLLERFSDELLTVAPPRSRVDLLRLYVASDLAASGNPMELAVWSRDSLRPDAELVIADFERRPEGERSMVAEASASGRAVLREVSSAQGVQLVLAVPVDSTRLVTVVVSPRTRLIGDDPFASLLGLEAPTIVEPPYRLQVASLARDAGASVGPAWERIGDELHGDWRIGGMRGFVRAHVEVELRSLNALVQRGVLLVLLDLAIVALLWTLAAFADGAFWRWMQLRLRRWQASYRARLTVALFAAFVLPAAAFALWTYGRLQDEDRFSRELLVRETLRAVAATSDVGRLTEEGKRLDTPLFLYSGGVLRRSSDELYDALVPLGRYLDPVAARSVAFGDEVAANRRLTVGGVPTLVGYRVLMDTRSERIILAAPARRSEQPLERQRSDLAVLLAFATAIGALAALALSGVVARGLAAPIGELRSAALDLAGGAGSLPSLGSRPPYEFRPVYSAFRQMASDLGASRQALLEAQRRTEAVLRNVASGVIACDPDGTVTLANARAERILGRPVVPGEPLAALGIPALAVQLARFVGNDSRPDDEGLELTHRGRELRARLTRLARGAGGVVVTLDDVTDVARAQRVFAWGEMARQVAHEIKNPLTPIRLGVQHLRRARADRREDFDAILERNVARILAEIDHLDEIARSFSKFGTVPGERAAVVPTDVAAVLRDVVGLERLGDAGVRWTVEGDDHLLAMSLGDELREVLLNLLENARHANATHVAARVGRDGERVVIEIRDDGDGVAPDALPRVFEPHFSTRTSGSGLGLAISKRLVDSWGGSIQLAPASPRGTIASVTLVPAPSA